LLKCPTLWAVLCLVDAGVFQQRQHGLDGDTVGPPGVDHVPNLELKAAVCEILIYNHGTHHIHTKYVYICIYIYVYVSILNTYRYVYIYTNREKDRKKQRRKGKEKGKGREGKGTERKT
jgi:hypothetical protein